MEQKNEMKLEAGKNTHENVIFSCFGGFSNTGIVSAMASLDAVKELGLKKAAIGCLGGLPTNVGAVFAKTNAAKKIITVDGCSKECAKKVVENAGFKVSKSIVLVRDIDMIKKPLNEDINADLKEMMEYISDEDVQKAKQLIMKSIND